jgi:hypothetical protein
MPRPYQCIVVFAVALMASSSHAMPPPMPTHVLRDVQVLPGGEMLLLHTTGIYRRAPGDKAWTLTLAAPEVAQLLIGPGGSYAIGLDAMYASTDKGATWTKRERHNVGSLGADGTLYGCAKSGEESSSDQGRTWKALTAQQRIAPGDPAWCANSLRVGRGLYVLTHENRLIHRNGDSANWNQTSVQRHFVAEQYIMSMFRDANDKVYLNTLIKASARKIYRGSHDGKQWDAIAWTSATGMPLDPELFAIMNGTLFMTCAKPKPASPISRYLCESKASDPGVVTFKARALFNATGATFRTAPDGRVYYLDQYSIERTTKNRDEWEPVGLEGIPDPFGRPREKVTP